MAGRAYVFDGQTGTVLHTLFSPNEESGGSFGFAVSGAGDTNGDGYADVIVGACYEDTGTGWSDLNAGRAYVFDGYTGLLLYTLISLNGDRRGRFGYSVSGAGDVNGNGYDDVVVGAPYEEAAAHPNDEGLAYVFDGQTATPLHTLISPNAAESGWFGWSVSGVGDTDGHGYDDVVVGAFFESPGSSPEGAGRAHLFDGRSGALLHTFTSLNEEYFGHFGHAVSGAGDVNGDGNNDVVVATESTGRAYVFNGQTGTALHALIPPNELDSGWFGFAVSGAGDTNGDGYADVIIGAHREDTGPSTQDAGRAYVFSWMHLSAMVYGDQLQLQWSPWPTAREYWIYGADNLPYFDPGFAPGYQYRLDEVVLPTTTWSTSAGVCDPNHNWTYIVISVTDSENELARSDYCGEHDFSLPVP
jgi:hypothetical protein